VGLALDISQVLNIRGQVGGAKATFSNTAYLYAREVATWSQTTPQGKAGVW